MGEHWWGIDTKNPSFWPTGLQATNTFGHNSTFDPGLELAMNKLKAEGLGHLSNAYLCVAVGSGWHTFNDYVVNKTRIVEPNFNKKTVAEKMTRTFTYWKNRIEDVQNIADRSPTMYDYLSMNIHK